jgi:glycosyltransferase involved in cell wall biosynthesis
MRLVMFCHPNFLKSQSMPRFAGMLKSAYEERGHGVEVWSPRAKAYNWVRRGRFAKWGGYFDQYVLFPMDVRKALKRTCTDTLFVFCDQALGPWVPLVKNRPHVVHVHDLLALRSALGCLRENPTSLTGRLYQRYIRRGFRQARHFICVSKKTRDDLHRFGGIPTSRSEVVYSGMHFPYVRVSREEARGVLQAAGLAAPAAGMLLHVGGGQWYKNLPGIIAIYAQYAAREPGPLPLWCIGPAPNAAATAALARVPRAGQVHFIGNLDNTVLQAAYSHARAFLLPSLAEGFGWPLIEAQACGCPVITTDEPPMNEVAGAAACYLPRLKRGAQIDAWAAQGAEMLCNVLAEDGAERTQRMQAGQSWARRFDHGRAIDAYLAIYRKVLDLRPAPAPVETSLGQGTGP